MDKVTIVTEVLTEAQILSVDQAISLESPLMSADAEYDEEHRLMLVLPHSVGWPYIAHPPGLTRFTFKSPSLRDAAHTLAKQTFERMKK
jgi:uncharacterized UPF0160 family protein